MKQPKKPTRQQKEVIADNNLNWLNWMVVMEDDFHLCIVNKISRNQKLIPKLSKKESKNRQIQGPK